MKEICVDTTVVRKFVHFEEGEESQVERFLTECVASAKDLIAGPDIVSWFWRFDPATRDAHLHIGNGARWHKLPIAFEMLGFRPTVVDYEEFVKIAGHVLAGVDNEHRSQP